MIILTESLFDDAMVQLPDTASCSGGHEETGNYENPTGALLSSGVYTTSRASIFESHSPSILTTAPSFSHHDDAGDRSTTTPSMTKTDHDVLTEFYKHTCQCKKADG